MRKEILTSSEYAYKYAAEAVAFMSIVEKQFNNTGVPIRKAFGIDKAVIYVECNAQRVRCYIDATGNLFATTPHMFHDKDYPFSSIQRGVMDMELAYVPPTEDDTETKVEAGNCYWHGLETTLSWRGSIGFNLATDYYEADPIDITYLDPQNNEGASGYFLYTNYGPCVYEDEEIVWGVDGDEGDIVPLVMGACYFEGQLIVIGRIFNGERFVLNAYNLAREVLATVEVGRYNSIWNFKKDGSAGISSDAGKMYRCTIGLDDDDKLLVVFAPEENIERVPIALSRTEVNTTLTVPDGPIPYTPYALVPVHYASLSDEDKAAFDALAEFSRTQTNTKTITANGSGTHILYYSYDELDNEVQLEYEIDIDISHYYQTKVYTKNDLMLLVPEGSVGLKDAGPCLEITGTGAGAIVKYLGHDLNPIFTGINITPYQDSKTLYTLDEGLCPGAVYTISNCTGGSVTCTPNIAETELVITVTGTTVKTATASGGVPPYTFRITAGKILFTNESSITFTCAGPATSGVASVEDKCFAAAETSYTLTAAKWAFNSTIYDSGFPGSCSLCSGTPGQFTATKYEPHGATVAQPPAADGKALTYVQTTYTVFCVNSCTRNLTLGYTCNGLKAEYGIIFSCSGSGCSPGGATGDEINHRYCIKQTVITDYKLVCS